MTVQVTTAVFVPDGNLQFMSAAGVMHAKKLLQNQAEQQCYKYISRIPLAYLFPGKYAGFSHFLKPTPRTARNRKFSAAGVCLSGMLLTSQSISRAPHEASGHNRII